MSSKNNIRRIICEGKSLVEIREDLAKLTREEMEELLIFLASKDLLYKFLEALN